MNNYTIFFVQNKNRVVNTASFIATEHELMEYWNAYRDIIRVVNMRLMKKVISISEMQGKSSYINTKQSYL